jgi:hypothetical protein
MGVHKVVAECRLPLGRARNQVEIAGSSLPGLELPADTGCATAERVGTPAQVSRRPSPSSG